MISPQVLIADVLHVSPHVASLLLELRVDCLGCSMNKFCTLEELSGHYGLDTNNLIRTIQEQINIPPE